MLRSSQANIGIRTYRGYITWVQVHELWWVRRDRLLDEFRSCALEDISVTAGQLTQTEDPGSHYSHLPPCLS